MNDPTKQQYIILRMTPAPKTFTFIRYIQNYEEDEGGGYYNQVSSLCERRHGLTKEELVAAIADHQVNLPKEIDSDENRIYWFEEHRLLGESTVDYENRMREEWADVLKEVSEHLKAAQERKAQAMEIERIRQEELEKRRKEASKEAEKARDLAELRRLRDKWPGEA